MKGFSVFISFSSIALISLMISGCGSGFESKSYESQKIYTAPQVISDELLAAGLSVADVSTLMAQNPQARVRELSEDTFEFKGLEKSQILEVQPQAIIEKNRFLKIEGLPVKQKPMELLESDLLNDETENEFTRTNCLRSRSLPTPKIILENTSLETSIPLGKELSFQFEQVQIKVDGEDTPLEGITAWSVFNPMGSLVNVKFNPNSTLKLKPDMPGIYTVALYFKAGQVCNATAVEISISDNRAYQSKLNDNDIGGLQKLSLRDFKQLSNTNADFAQKLVLKKTPVIVAVLDSGVNYNHPALKRNMWINEKEIPDDGIDNDGNGFVDDVVGYDFADNDSYPSDEVGHGTHVAGLVAGDFMGTGNMPNVKVMALKGGSAKGLDVGSIVKGINYAVDNYANIINMSFGGEKPSPITERAIARANVYGVLVVAAAGNGDRRGRGVNNDNKPLYPSGYDLPNILSVAASKADGSLTGYSNYGIEQVDIAAIGGHATFFERSANMLNSAYLPNPSGILVQPMSGTSMASPVVSGIAALALSANPNLTPHELRNLIMTTGKKMPVLTEVIKSGSVIDAEAAVLAAQNGLD